MNGKDLKDLRKILGISLQAAAGQIGISISTLQRLEAGSKPKRLVAEAVERWAKMAPGAEGSGSQQDQE